MECRHVLTSLNDFMDGYLDPADTQAIQEHLGDCGRCGQIVASEQKFRRALRQMEVEPPDEGFADRVLAQAVGGEEHHRHWWSGFLAGGGVAVAVAMIVILGLLYRGSHPAIQQLAGVTLAVDVPRTVQMVVNVPQDLENSTITILLPEGVELAGYPEDRIITWTADLRKGGNLLALPVVARRTGSTTLVARVEHERKRKTFEVNLDVQQHLSGEERPFWFAA
jgi:hypothetical protein